MFKEEKEIISVDNKEFIRLADAMQVIAPTASNAARWFKQHQESFPPETFIVSDEGFPGKKGRIWITIPEGFQTLASVCIKAPRLKIPEGVEERIKPFCVQPSKGVVVTDDLDIVFEQEIAVVLSVPTELDKVESILTASTEDRLTVNPAKLQEPAPSQSKITQYPMSEEKIFGMGTESSRGEAWVDFLTHSISTLAKDYHAKMEWLDKMNRDAPVELHNPIVELYNTLHDTLVDGIIEDILQFKSEAPGVKDKSPEVLQFLVYFDQCLKKGYAISLEAVQEGIFCSINSDSVVANFFGRTWQEAFEKTAEQILQVSCCFYNHSESYVKATKRVNKVSDNSLPICNQAGCRPAVNQAGRIE